MKKLIIVVVISSILCAITALYYSYYPTIKQYGYMEVKRLNQLIVSKSAGNNKSYKDILIIEKDSDNKIETVHFNMIVLNQISNTIVNDLMNTYQSIENGTYKAKDQSYYEKRIEDISHNGISSQIPLCKPLNIFPITIPVKFKNVAYIGSNIKRKVENYGLNHIMIEISIEVNINLVMVYPFFKEYETYRFDVPVLLELYEGQIPDTYIQRGGV